MTDGPAIDQSGMKRLVQIANADAGFSARYRLGNALGVGGSGVVFSAVQLGIQRTVAVKFLVTLEEDDLQRFRREARLLAGVRHAHVVALYELGELTQYPYLVTEFLPGGSLRDTLRQGRMKLAGGLRACLDALSGLAACHEAGFVHRDVKPANILFDAGGRAKISDLGLARHEADSSLTRTGSLVGTPRYMAPEQVRGERAVVGSDIYAIGLVIYEVLAGRQVFIAETLPGLLHMQLEREPDPLESLAPDVPPALARAVHRALAKKIEDRPATVVQLYDDIRRAAAEAALDVSHGSGALVNSLAHSSEMPAPEPPPAALATGSTKARKTGLVPAADETAARSRRTGSNPATESANTVRKTRPARALERSRRRIPMALIVAVAMLSGLVSGVIVMMLTRSAPADRALAGVPQVRAGATTARIAWQTRAGARGGVLVWPDGRPQEEGLAVDAGPGEKPGLDHAVVVAGLKAATAFRFRVRHEDGSHSPDSYAFSTRAEPDLISAPTVRVVSATHARITWKHRAPVTPGVRVVGGRADAVYWPLPAQPDSVDVPLDAAALNRLEICFREFESPPPATGVPERLPLPAVPGPDAARRWLVRALGLTRENDIRGFCRTLLAIPYDLVPSIKRLQVRPGEELVKKLTAAQTEKVIDEVRRAGRKWLATRLVRAAEPGTGADKPDLDVILSAAAAWLADAAHPIDEREAFRDALMRLCALDAAGQLTGSTDVLGIDDVVMSRIRVDRRAGRPESDTGESVLEPLGLTGTLPLPLPVGIWGSEQISWMAATGDARPTMYDHVQATITKLALPDPADGPSRRWYRLAPLSRFLHPSAGLHINVQVTNMDPSLAVTLRIGQRNILLRNTMNAYLGYVDLASVRARDSLERRASTLKVQVVPGVLSDTDRAVSICVDAFANENTQGTFATPPICWFHDISMQP